MCICGPEGDLVEQLSTPVWPPGGARQQRWVLRMQSQVLCALPLLWPCYKVSRAKIMSTV